jgi:hypothetical protein
MYFNSDVQSRILSRFHYAMADDGLLLLGKAEMLLTRSKLFEPADLRCRLFRKINRFDPRERLAALVPPRREEIRAEMSKPPDMYSVAFEAAPIAHIVVEAGGALAMFNDRARSLFDLAPADVGRPFHELELSYRPVELRSLIQDAGTSSPGRRQGRAPRRTRRRDADPGRPGDAALRSAGTRAWRERDVRRPLTRSSSRRTRSSRRRTKSCNPRSRSSRRRTRSCSRPTKSSRP